MNYVSGSSMNYVSGSSSTNRLILFKHELPESKTDKESLIKVLDVLSVWGGAASITDKYISWEFNNSITKEVILMVLKRFGCNLGND